MRPLVRKTLLGGVIAVIAVVVVVSIIAFVALATPFGARMAIAAAGRFVPGELTVAGVDGSVVGGLVLHSVAFSSPAVTAELERIVIEPDLAAIASGRAVLERLALETGIVTLREPGATAPGTPPAAAPGEPPTLPEIPDWLAVRSLEVRDVALAGGVDAAVAALDARVAGPQVTIDRLAASVAGGRLEAAGRAELDGARGRIEGTYVLPPQAVDAGAADTRIEVAAEFALETSATPWRATLAWDRLAVQAAGRQWSSPEGRLSATPGTMPIAAQLEARLATDLLPDPAVVSAGVTLAGDVLELDELVIEVLGGRIVASGVANVRELAGHAVFEYAMLDPSMVDPRVEGELSGAIVTAFEVDPVLVASASGTFGGTLGGRPLDGTLRAAYRDGAASIDSVRVELGDGAITAAGVVGPEQVDLTFEAEVPELERWYPPVAGALSARGSIMGPTRDPAIDVELTADNVVVESLPPLDALSVVVMGTLAEHGVQLAAASPIGELSVRVEQGWTDERLAGTVLESRLAIERAGTWSLAMPADYSAAGSAVTLAPLCYAGPEQAQLCVAVADETLEVEADDLPSTLAEPWIGDVRLAGAADLDLVLGWQPHLHGTLTLTQPALRVLPPAEAGADEPTVNELAALDDLSVTAELSDAQVAARLSATIAATGDPIQGRVTVAPPTAEGALDAALTAQLTSLELVDALVEDVEGLSGTIDVNLRAAGTVAAPELAGELAVRSLGAFLPALGIEVANGRLTARGEGADALVFDAELCSTGCVTLDGALDLDSAAQPWQLTAELTGDSFLLAELEELRAVVAPDLMLEATPERVLVTGELLIEEGAVMVETLPPTAVRPVEATVVYGRDVEVETEALAIPLVVNVEVRLGDVQFTGLGVAAELGGSLDIERTAEGQLLVDGTAAIEEGTFSAYAQTLEIERGDLIFTGPPENPALDVRATREVEGATVGLALTGTLREPRSEVFSMPALSDSEALARLVTGRSLESAGPQDAEAIERAAIGLGLRRALPALDRIGENLGLDELGVESAGDESGAIVAGRQLGDDVYLRYKHGLFDDFAGLELIYRITERFRLRTETGTSQSIDLIYERNPRRETPLEETGDPFEDATAPAAVDARPAAEGQ